MRTQISDPDIPFWWSFLVPCSTSVRKYFFTSFLHQTNQYNYCRSSSSSVSCITDRLRLQHVSAGAESSVCFNCRGHPAALSSPRLTCQFLRILTPHRLGGAIGRPRRLVTHVPSFPRAKQHHARHAESELYLPDVTAPLKKKRHAIWKDVRVIGAGHLYCCTALLSSAR